MNHLGAASLVVGRTVSKISPRRSADKRARFSIQQSQKQEKCSKSLRDWRKERKKTERSARRRLDIVSRHLVLQPEAFFAQLQPEANHVLCPVLVKAGCTPEEQEADPVVIGGMVLDIHATSSIPPCPRTTTVGQVHYVLEGLARNIAECMSKLEARPYMISAARLDLAGPWHIYYGDRYTNLSRLDQQALLLGHWISAGLSTGGIRKHKDIRTAVVCNIFETNGESAAAVASVEAIVG